MVRDVEKNDKGDFCLAVQAAVTLLLKGKAVLMKDLLLGTWKYQVKEAPFGFRTGKAIFFEEKGELKAQLKILGLTINTKDLKIEATKISFAAEVDIEQVLIELELKGGKLEGYAHISDASMPIVMTQKGATKRSEKEITESEPETAISKALEERKKLQKELCTQIDAAERSHTFYYGWYGNPEFNKDYIGWNSGIIPHKVQTKWNDLPPYPGGDDLAANFYPQLGSYSSIDPEVIETHIQQIRDAGIGAVVLSWWGKDHFTNESVPAFLDTAQKYGLKIIFHLEPFYNTVDQFRTQLAYISESYNPHPAIYRFNGLPFYYLYNSFKLDHQEWYGMMNPESATTLRNTPLDGIFINLWTTQFDGKFTVKSGFDGFYTYYASDGFSYGSTTSNWKHLSQFARENNLIYIPCVGPGYVDTRIRPWNEKTTKNRDGGRYYEEMMKNAVETNPDFIGITSFNEWFEGTQIEPSVPKTISSFTYEDYGNDADPSFYIKKTKTLINRYVKNNQPKAQ